MSFFLVNRRGHALSIITVRWWTSAYVYRNGQERNIPRQTVVSGVRLPIIYSTWYSYVPAAHLQYVTRYELLLSSVSHLKTLPTAADVVYAMCQRVPGIAWYLRMLYPDDAILEYDPPCSWTALTRTDMHAATKAHTAAIDTTTTTIIIGRYNPL